MTELKRAIRHINDAIARFKPARVFALLSGGHDSLTSCYIASQAKQFDGAVHINTGIGIPATRQFVVDTCLDRGFPLHEYKATENTRADGTPDPQVYDDIVLKHGFPGPASHGRMYARLKERQIRRLERDSQGQILLISGARADESERRMRHSPDQVEGKRVWCAPIWNWAKSSCSDLLTRGRFERNQAALRFGRSGECLCGAFVSKGELAALEFACPASAERIRSLEKKVRRAGFPWGWEDERPPEWFREKKQGQTFMFGYDQDETLVEEHLCTSCKWRKL